MLSWMRVSARRPGAPHAEAEFQPVLLGVDPPFERHVPALGDAEGLENAHGGNFRGGVFAHDLAHHQLQGQAMLALLLLGHIAQQAAHGKRIAGLLPLAEAQLQFQHAAVGSVVAQRGAVHRLAIQGAAEERGHLSAATRSQTVPQTNRAPAVRQLSMPKHRFQAGLA